MSVELGVGYVAVVFSKGGMVFSKGCRGFLHELPWFYTRVAVVFSVIAKVKSTPSPRPKTGFRQ